MKSLRTSFLSLATMTAILLTSGAAVASGGSRGTWPSAYPLPTQPGRVLSQTPSTAVVRSADTVLTVKTKLDSMYVGRLGCTRVAAVNKPRDYFCRDAATGKTVEVYFTFAALDPKPTDRSQTNAFLVR
jgi:hypothetical protein